MKWKRAFLRVLTISTLVMCALLTSCVSLEQLLEKRDKAAVTAHDTFLTADGKRIRYRLLSADKRGPTIVLLTGLSGFIEQWDHVQTALSVHYRVLTYDRGGMGFSDPARAHDALGMADELATVLASLGIGQDSVVVSYSASAFMARVFAGRYPLLTKGLVFIDPATRDNRWLAAPYHPVSYTYDLGPWLTRSTLSTLLGYGRFRNYWRLRDTPPATPAESKVRRLQLRSRHWMGSMLEGLLLERSARQAEAVSLPGSIPVGVISTYSPSGDAMTLAQQQELVRGLNGTFRYIHGVPHVQLLEKQVSRPVIDLIVHIVERVRTLASEL